MVSVSDPEMHAGAPGTVDPAARHSDDDDISIGFEPDESAPEHLEPARRPTRPPSTLPPGRYVRRNRTLAIGLAIVVLASTVSWWAGRQIRSPAEVAARTAAPAASRISVPVERRVLTSQVITRGTVRYGSPQAITLPKSALKGGSSIVTKAPTKAAELGRGDVAMTVSGRPVFILQGAQPAYRDLGRGDEGTDVEQLENSLAALGFDPGSRDGRYDGRTASAVAAWYQAAGWSPFGPTTEQQQALRSAKGELFTAQTDRLASEQALTAARAEHAAAAADVIGKQATLNGALDAVNVASLQLSEAQGSSTPSSAAELAALQAAINEARGAVVAAQADLTAANAAAREKAEIVAVAQRLVTLSHSRSDTVGGEVGVLATEADIQVPADEVLFFPTLPLRVDDVAVKDGDEATGPVMTVSSSSLAVDGALSAQDAKLVRGGAAVTIDAADLGVQAAGTVTLVADEPGTQGVDPQRFYLQVTPADAPATIVGASVVLTITVGATEGKALAVPVAALWVAADGSSRVQVESRSGATRFVKVKPGLAANGMVAVTPLRGRLAAGDLVVVGRGARSRATNAAGA